MFNNRKGREQGQGCPHGFTMRRRERHDYPRWKETTLPRRLSLPQISRLLKRNERRPIFLFSNGSPSSRPPWTLCPYTRTWRVSPSLDDSSRKFSLSYHPSSRDLRLWWTIPFPGSIVAQFSGATVRARLDAYYDAFGTRFPRGEARNRSHFAFTVASPSLSLAWETREQVKKVVIGSLSPFFFFSFFFFFALQTLDASFSTN